jgi:hypothetical protein
MTTYATKATVPAVSGAAVSRCSSRIVSALLPHLLRSFGASGAEGHGERSQWPSPTPDGLCGRRNSTAIALGARGPRFESGRPDHRTDSKFATSAWLGSKARQAQAQRGETGRRPSCPAAQVREPPTLSDNALATLPGAYWVAWAAPGSAPRAISSACSMVSLLPSRVALSSCSEESWDRARSTNWRPVVSSEYTLTMPS